MARSKKTTQVTEKAVELSKQSGINEINAQEVYVKKLEKELSTLHSAQKRATELSMQKMVVENDLIKSNEVIQEYNKLITEFVTEWKKLERRAWVRKIFLVIDFVKDFVAKIEKTRLVIKEENKKA